MTVRGTTRVTQIIGHPIAQVLSPQLFNEHVASLGLDVVLIPVDLHPDRLREFVGFQRGFLNSAGFLVTMPHKRTAPPLLDALTERAKRLQAVNVVRRREDGTLLGDMVDGLGFMAAAETHGFSARGKSALVVGTGGAGSAIVDALCEQGIARLALADVDAERVRTMRRLFTDAFPSVELLDEHEGLDGFDLVVNASPAGMGDEDKLPIPQAQLATLRTGTLVADVVTKPAMTKLLREAEARGCPVQTGPEMAAAQIEILGRCMGVLS